MFTVTVAPDSSQPRGWHRADTWLKVGWGMGAESSRHTQWPSGLSHYCKEVDFHRRCLPFQPAPAAAPGPRLTRTSETSQGHTAGHSWNVRLYPKSPGAPTMNPLRHNSLEYTLLKAIPSSLLGPTSSQPESMGYPSRRPLKFPTSKRKVYFPRCFWCPSCK